MTFGNNQCMTRRYRITIVEGNTSSCLAYDFHPAGKTAERTFYAFLARQLVEVVIHNLVALPTIYLFSSFQPILLLGG